MNDQCLSQQTFDEPAGLEERRFFDGPAIENVQHYELKLKTLSRIE
jgi:hypothetical protein